MSSGSSGSSSTNPGYSPKIAVIRETSGAEIAHGTVYIKRQDGFEEIISSVWGYSAYSMDFGDSLLLQNFPEDFWKAYNTMARFILTGRIRLSGGRDCFNGLARRPQDGVKSLEAGRGIFFTPDEDMATYGEIFPRAQGDLLTKAHISSRKNYNNGQPKNSITLSRRKRYLVAGDDSKDDSSAMMPISAYPELLICHRGRLLEAGFEIPGGIGRKDLWLLDSAGKWQGTYPLQGRVICSSCLQSYANREWPVLDACEGSGHCDNARNDVGAKDKERGYRPALAEVECAPFLVRTYRGPRAIYSRRTVRDVARVLDANFTVRDWDHLSEITGYSHRMLAVLFCSVPSLGQRLNKKGACFVPWASESGIFLGDYLRLRVEGLRALYIVLGQAVIEIYTGLKTRFEEDSGVTHVERGSPDFSEQLPVGVSRAAKAGLSRLEAEGEEEFSSRGGNGWFRGLRRKWCRGNVFHYFPR